MANKPDKELERLLRKVVKKEISRALALGDPIVRKNILLESEALWRQIVEDNDRRVLAQENARRKPFYIG